MHKSREDFDVLSQLFQGSDDAVVVCNVTGEIILFNAAAARIYGAISSCRLEDCPKMLGMDVSDGSRLLDLDEMPMAQALKGKEVRGFEILLRRERMPDRSVRVDAYPLWKGDKVTLMGAMVRSRLV